VSPECSPRTVGKRHVFPVIFWGPRRLPAGSRRFCGRGTGALRNSLRPATAVRKHPGRLEWFVFPSNGSILTATATVDTQVFRECHFGNRDEIEVIDDGQQASLEASVKSLHDHPHGTAWFDDAEVIRTGRFVAWPDRRQPADAHHRDEGGTAVELRRCGLSPIFLFAAEGVKKIVRYGREGVIVWEYPAEMARDVWQLPSGNILFCYNQRYDPRRQDNPSGVMEVTPDRKIAFQFSTIGQVWSCQRLPDGNTLVGASSQGKLLVVNPQGAMVREIKVLNAPGHSCMRNARQVAGGNYLVAEESAHAAREYSPAGKLVREIKLMFAPYSVVRLKNGNTLVCGQKSIVEIDSGDKLVWSLEGNEIPQAGIRWFAGIQVLPNGNLFVCNAGGRTAFLEINRNKQIVWQSNMGASNYPLGHGIHRVDVPGPPEK
jgi:hypothetical protein